MDEHELRKIRLLKKYADLPQEFLDDGGFDPELTELFLEQVNAAIENQWPIPNRFQWEHEFKQEVRWTK